MNEYLCIRKCILDNRLVDKGEIVLVHGLLADDNPCFVKVLKVDAETGEGMPKEVVKKTSKPKTTGTKK